MQSSGIKAKNSHNAVIGSRFAGLHQEKTSQMENTDLSGSRSGGGQPWRTGGRGTCPQQPSPSPAARPQ